MNTIEEIKLIQELIQFGKPREMQEYIAKQQEMHTIKYECEPSSN